MFSSIFLFGKKVTNDREQISNLLMLASIFWRAVLEPPPAKLPTKNKALFKISYSFKLLHELLNIQQTYHHTIRPTNSKNALKKARYYLLSILIL